MITKATEMFVQDLSGVCGQIAKAQKRKTLQIQDIVNAANNIDKFHFIKGKIFFEAFEHFRESYSSNEPKETGRNGD
jgi:hypothetical protein